MDNELCTVYDCEFDLYHKALIKDNMVYILDKEENPVPVRDYICEHVDFDRVQFYTGYDYDIPNPESEKVNSKWGYLKLSTGKIIIPPKYDYAAPFYGNRAEVKKNMKYGFINPEGKEVIDITWEETAGAFYKDLCWVKKDNKFGYINKAGIIVLSLQFEKVEQFESVGKGNKGDYEYTALVKKDGKYGYIDIQGNYIVEPTFDHIKKFWFRDYVAVKSFGKWGFINKRGEVVADFEFDEVGESGSLSYKEIDNEKKSFGGCERIDFYTIKKEGNWGIMFSNLDIITIKDSETHVIYKNMKIYMKNGHVTSTRKLKAK